MPVIKVIPEGIEFAYNDDSSLLELLLRQKIFIENPCNGHGTCGKCKVRHISGKLPPLSGEEKIFLSLAEQNNNIRLACCIFPCENITLELVQNKKSNKILADGFMPEYVFDPAVYKRQCTIAQPGLTNQKPYAELFADFGEHLKTKKPVNLKMLQHLPVTEKVCTALYQNEELLFIEPGDTTDALYGLAIDIGTTTVVVSLVDLLTGKIMGNATGINAQNSYGSDVLTRIAYVLENLETGVKELQKIIIDNINGLIQNLCKKNNIESRFIYDIAVAANPTMMHLLLGVNPAPIGTSPYIPIFSTSLDLSAKETGLLCADACRLYCLPGVSAYIGSDVVAGAYVSGLAEEKSNVLFIDIGTNGEIILAHNGELVSCSCAAGPAFEGMNISAGTRAVSGAIEDVIFEQNSFKITTIDNEEANGICGSGIMAAVRELLAVGFLKSNGSLYKDKDFSENDCRRDFLWTEGRGKGVYLYKGETTISITQNDIRQVQLAKAAILSGFCALLEIAGLSMSDLDKVIVAGQFGSHLPAGSLVGTGLVPAELSEKIEYIGNSAHSGAYLALVSRQSRNEMEKLAPRINYKELSVLPDYERLFRKCMEF